ncbi:MAG: hypothetical protein JNM17_26695 [Archangium sp.]|nr:hypothetical protein [Archangium sp.]
MLTLILFTSLQVSTSIDLSAPTHQPTRESIQRSSRGVRVLAMTATTIGAVGTTALLGAFAGALGGALTSGGWGGIAGGLVGLGIGGGVGLLLSPLLVWAVGRALGGEGTVGAAFVGMLVGAALGAAGFGLAVTLNLTAAASWIPVIVAAPAAFAGGLWAFEISDATIYVAPTSVAIRF